MSYQILHIIAYLHSQDIPEELMILASRRVASEEGTVNQATELEVWRAITRLKEFSFFSMCWQEAGGRMYEMHKLV